MQTRVSSRYDRSTRHRRVWSGLNLPEIQHRFLWWFSRLPRPAAIAHDRHIPHLAGMQAAERRGGWHRQRRSRRARDGAMTVLKKTGAADTSREREGTWWTGPFVVKKAPRWDHFTRDGVKAMQRVLTPRVMYPARSQSQLKWNTANQAVHASRHSMY